MARKKKRTKTMLTVAAVVTSLVVAKLVTSQYPEIRHLKATRK